MMVVPPVETEKPAPRKYRIDRDALSHDSSKEMRKIQQKSQPRS
jgi:hypothetical protein